MIKVDNVSPSKETIQNGSYKIQRNFVLVTKTGSELSSAAKDFFEFATSSGADELIEKAGAIPVVR